ncbi:MAG: murein transglycosylase A [Alphaproteobacteria bacterium]|nr:murein transglycosylase A [Alphaproteobacteria bacterium]
MFRNRQLLAVALLALVACSAPPPNPPSGSRLHLSRVHFSDLPDWSGGNADAALAAFRRSCAVLAVKPDTAAMGGAGYAGTAADWRKPCADVAGDAKTFFEKDFTPYAVSGSDGLFTGYYEPEIRGSRTQHGAFQTPVYGLPPDLVRADLGLFNPRLKGEHISGKVVGRALLPYPDRAQINAQGLDAPILFYTDDAIAFFFLQIQGSGRVVFDDGSSARIAYAGENGQPYTAIGRTLIADGSLPRETVSLQTIRAWLVAHPSQARAVMESDRSYIFFEQKPLGDTALGGTGSQGVNVTPLASIAVDQRVHALGAPFYVAADGPDPVHRVMIAQDTGGAIRGPVRADIFFGFGAEAEARAGAMKAPGRLYVLLPNALSASLGESRDYPL